MKSIYIIVCWFVILAGLCLAPVRDVFAVESAYSVRFESRQFEHKKLAEMAALDADDNLSRSEVNEAVERLFGSLASVGFPLATIDSVTIDAQSDHTALSIYLNEGKPTTLGTVGEMAESASADPDGIAGARLTEELLTQIGEARAKQLVDSGFPFAAVTISPNNVIEADEVLEVDLKFIVAKGPFMRLGDVKYTGLLRTRVEYLTRVSRLKRGDVFKAAEIAKAEERLKGLEFIRQAGPVVLHRESPGVLGVEFPIVERSANFASGVAALSPGGDKPSGELHLRFGNLLGTGRQLQFEWLGLEQQRKGIRVEYMEPWLLKRPIHATVALERWTTDTSATVTRYKTRLIWEPTDRLSGYAGVAWETISLSISDSTTNNLQTMWLETGLIYDRMDHRWNPTTGWTMTVESAAGQRSDRQVSGAGSTIRRDEFSVRVAKPMAAQFVWHTEISGRDLSGETVVIDELLRVGGVGSIRGYDEGQSLARGVARGAIEVRWRPDDTAYIGLFLDAARIYRIDERVAPADRNLISSGISANIETRAGNIGLDIGFARGEPLDQARLHFRLNTRF